MMGKGHSKHKRDNDLAQAERLTMMANMKMAYADALIKQYHTSPSESRAIVSQNPSRSRSHECLSTVRVSRDQNHTTPEACREDGGLAERRSRATSMATLMSAQQQEQQQRPVNMVSYSKSFPRRHREFKKVLVHNHPDLTKLQNEQNKRRESMERRICEIRKHAEEEEKRKSLPLPRQQHRLLQKNCSYVNTNLKEAPLLKMPGADQDEGLCITDSPLLRLIHNEKRRKTKINNNNADEAIGTSNRPLLDNAFHKTNESSTTWHSISLTMDKQLETAFHSTSESVDSWHSISSTSSVKNKEPDSDDSGEIIPVRILDSSDKQPCSVVSRNNETLTEGKVRSSHKPLVKQPSQGVDPFSLDLFKNNSPWLLLLLPILLPALLLSVIVKALSQTRADGKDSVKGREQQQEQELNNHVIR